MWISLALLSISIILFLHILSFLSYKKSTEVHVIQSSRPPSVKHLQEKQPYLQDGVSLESFEHVSSIQDVWQLLPTQDILTLSNFYGHSKQSSVDEVHEGWKDILFAGHSKDTSYFVQNNSSILTQLRWKDEMYGGLVKDIRGTLSLATSLSLSILPQNYYTPTLEASHAKTYIHCGMGSLRVRLVHPRFSTVLTQDMLEKTIDLWNPAFQDLPHLKQLKYTDVYVHEGQTLFIPPWWFYSCYAAKDVAYIRGEEESIVSGLVRFPGIIGSMIDEP